jgi:hypothetical protein
MLVQWCSKKLLVSVIESYAIVKMGEYFQFD